jgi:hypothetical protein
MDLLFIDCLEHKNNFVKIINGGWYFNNWYITRLKWMLMWIYVEVEVGFYVQSTPP